jgi:hypothetical protein
LIYSSIYKAFVYGLLVFGFHMVEEAVKRLIHGKDIAGAFRGVRIDDLLGPQCDHFPGVHSFLCIQGAGARYRSGETSGPFRTGHGRAIILRLTNQETEDQRRNLKQEKSGPTLCKTAKEEATQRTGHLPFLVPYRFSFDNSAGWPKSRGPRGSYGHMKTYLG